MTIVLTGVAKFTFSNRFFNYGSKINEYLICFTPLSMGFEFHQSKHGLSWNIYQGIFGKLTTIAKQGKK